MALSSLCFALYHRSLFLLRLPFPESFPFTYMSPRAETGSNLLPAQAGLHSQSEESEDTPAVRCFPGNKPAHAELGVPSQQCQSFPPPIYILLSASCLILFLWKSPLLFMQTQDQYKLNIKNKGKSFSNITQLPTLRVRFQRTFQNT